METHNGRCECGAVRYLVAGPLRDVYYCHCGRCRRFTGHHLAATAAPRARVEIADDDAALTWHSPHPSVRYGFCGRCGSSLFWTSEARPETLSITAGSLDQPTGLRTTQAWFVDEAGDYHAREAGLEEFDREGTRAQGG